MEFFNWTEFTPASAEVSLPKLLSDAEKAVAEIEASEPCDYESLVWRLADATRELWRTWGGVCHVLGVMNSDAWRKIDEKFQPEVVAFSLRVGQSARLYQAAKRAAATEADPMRKRILSKMVEAAELSGVGLEGPARARFNEIQARLAKLSSDFANSVIDATSAFAYEKDGKTYTIDDANYPETMKQCADREVREKLCRARATRSPDNTPRIDEILALRREMAGLLGFADYASLSVSSKCAPDVAAVMRMIDELDEATAAQAKREDDEVAAVAKEAGVARVEPWDQAFFAERVRERKYAYSEEELKRHFEFNDVLDGLFTMADFLFGIKFEELAEASKPPVWHPDVRFFAVKEEGRVIAHCFLDPYVRNGLKRGGAWMDSFVDRDDRTGALPQAVVVLNLPEPDAEGKTYMPLREVETLFHEFGHALQCMLTRVGDAGASGITLVEWDAVEVASQFMENWCLDGRTGIRIPAELKAKVVAAKNFRAASACRRQLSFAKTDMLLHGGCRPDDPNAVKSGVFAHFGLPAVEGDLFLNAFTHIFAGGYAAGYYGYKWAEVMSADCYGAFEEAGLGDDGAMRRVGGRYRETVLALGGSLCALDVFREFRGRDPGIEALLRQQGLF